MLRVRKRQPATLLAWIAWIAAGCGGSSSPITPENPMDGIVLEQVAEAYRSFTLAKGGPPASLADLDKLKKANPAGVDALKKGDVVIFWGAKLPDTGEEPGAVPAPEILAYQKQVPEQGGYVLQLDRRIKKVTAEEFKVAPKAGKG